jgi:hypothetical protein
MNNLESIQLDLMHEFTISEAAEITCREFVDQYLYQTLHVVREPCMSNYDFCVAISKVAVSSIVSHHRHAASRIHDENHLERMSYVYLTQRGYDDVFLSYPEQYEIFYLKEGRKVYEKLKVVLYSRPRLHLIDYSNSTCFFKVFPGQGDATITSSSFSQISLLDDILKESL